MDLNHWPLGYEPNELPDCSTPRQNTLIEYANKGKMAGVQGFEPRNARTKTWCLTAWRHPKQITKLKEALYKSFLKKSS